MAKVRPEIKERLVADGRWRDFKAYREERLAEGIAPSDALDMAIAKICPEFAESRANTRRARAEESVAKARKAAGERVAAAGGRADELAAKRKKEAEDALVDASAFAGKPKCTANQIVDWVTDNLFTKVSVADAPSARAWAILSMCRESVRFREEFVLKTTIEQIKRRADEESDAERWDGREQYDLCQAMRESADGVEGGVQP